MSISYPLSLPTSIGIASIELRAVNAVAVSESPFTYQQQTFIHPGQRWEASVSLPALRRDFMAPWKAFLTALKGRSGTFLLGDPDYTSSLGDASSCVVSGSAGDESVSVVMSGTLKAGDYLQLGSAGSARLHHVLQDQTGNGTLDIWPALREDYTSAAAVLDAPKGVFRLATNISAWTISTSNAYGISFEAVESIV